MKYTALGEGLVTNIAFGFACAIFVTRLSPRAVYFIQTGSSALSNSAQNKGWKLVGHSIKIGPLL